MFSRVKNLRGLPSLVRFNVSMIFFKEFFFFFCIFLLCPSIYFIKNKQGAQWTTSVRLLEKPMSRRVLERGFSENFEKTSKEAVLVNSFLVKKRLGHTKSLEIVLKIFRKTISYKTYIQWLPQLKLLQNLHIIPQLFQIKEWL